MSQATGRGAVIALRVVLYAALAIVGAVLTAGVDWLSGDRSFAIRGDNWWMGGQAVVIAVLAAALSKRSRRYFGAPPQPPQAQSPGGDSDSTPDTDR